MIKKGIVLAGGIGSRLSPATKSTNKQLLPLYDKPLFFLSTICLNACRDQRYFNNNKSQRRKKF